MEDKKSEKSDEPKKQEREKSLHIPLPFEKIVDAMLHTKPNKNTRQRKKAAGE